MSKKKINIDTITRLVAARVIEQNEKELPYIRMAVATLKKDYDDALQYLKDKETWIAEIKRNPNVIKG